jgi:hypothetical protein
LSTVLTKSLPQQRPAEANAAPRKKRAVIIGGGFAGIAAARSLRRSNVDILLLDRRNHHIFQPLLYQVATAVLAPSEIAAPLRQLEASQKNLRVLLAEVKGINLAARAVVVICPALAAENSNTTFWSWPLACVRAISAMTSSRGLRQGSRTSMMLKQSEPRSWAPSSWLDRPTTRKIALAK